MATKSSSVSPGIKLNVIHERTAQATIDSSPEVQALTKCIGSKDAKSAYLQKWFYGKLVVQTNCAETTAIFLKAMEDAVIFGCYTSTIFSYRNTETGDFLTDTQLHSCKEFAISLRKSPGTRALSIEELSGEIQGAFDRYVENRKK